MTYRLADATITLSNGASIDLPPDNAEPDNDKPGAEVVASFVVDVARAP